MKKNKTVLIIGKIPPPIGGVTIHVARLTQWLDKLGKVDYIFFDLSRKNFFTGVKYFFNSKTVHLHTSNPFFRFVISCCGFLFRKKIIITYHGDLLRFGRIKNIFDIGSVIFTSIPIVLNENSLKIAKRYNNNSQYLSAFIPPITKEELPEKIIERINILKQHTKYLFCTNAYNISFDKYGNEIYGILELVEKFSKKKDLGLIISDPSGNYKRYFEKMSISVTPNIYIINEPHNFIEILKLSDVFIRNTTTDGDSLSIHEALFLGKVVFATDVVSRPNECIIYKSIETVDLVSILNSQEKNYRLFKPIIKENIVYELINYYNETNHPRP